MTHPEFPLIRRLADAPIEFRIVRPGTSAQTADLRSLLQEGRMAAGGEIAFPASVIAAQEKAARSARIQDLRLEISGIEEELKTLQARVAAELQGLTKAITAALNAGAAELNAIKANLDSTAQS